MDDGRAVFTVFCVDDDIALKSVLCIPIRRVARVGSFREGDDRITRLVVNENEVACIDATQLAALIVNHGFGLNHHQGRHGTGVDEHRPNQTGDHANGERQLEEQRTQRVVFRHVVASNSSLDAAAIKEGFPLLKMPGAQGFCGFVALSLSASKFGR